MFISIKNTSDFCTVPTFDHNVFHSHVMMLACNTHWYLAFIIHLVEVSAQVHIPNLEAIKNDLVIRRHINSIMHTLMTRCTLCSLFVNVLITHFLLRSINIVLNMQL